MEASEVDADVRLPLSLSLFPRRRSSPLLPSSSPGFSRQFLTLAAPVQGVTVRLSAPYALGGGAEPGNALAVSNRFGWAVVAQPDSGERARCCG